jgi:uncharacterized cupin superfamily protein
MSTPVLISAIVDFSIHTTLAEQAVISLDRTVSASPIHTTTWSHYTDPTGQFFSGIWASEIGAMKISYTEEELCVILEGRVKLTANDGSSIIFGPGSTFVIPAGFKGIWETLEPVKKIYAIWQPQSPLA